MLSNKELFYLLVIWNLSSNFNNPNNDEKLMIFIDNLDCIDEYYELSNFISCIDALTVDFSDMFEKFKLSKIPNKTDTFVSKIKIFVAMRETTKANLPQSHFSDAFKSIYTNKDMTEWYDKGEIIKNRVSTLFKYDENNKLKDKQREQLKLVINISDDIYTKKVLYPLFNNNYRSAVDMLVEIVINNTQQMTKYSQLMAYDQPIYKHGARGILFKSIFDEFNKGDGNEESCFRQIGVLDLLNRKNNSVSICRLILSYLSNYTETKCDSGRNSIALSEIINDFTNVFSTNEVMKTLCAMFSLRDSKWSHLISFNQIDYKKDKNQIKGLIDLKDLNSDKTMVHYSCAGKIYIEYITTHFEFFNARIFKEQKEALFCDSNLAIDPVTKNYICCDIIDKIYTEVERCCLELKNFNIKLCNNNNYLNPYCNPAIYLDTHYICMFKRVDNDGKERRFKQFHEERIILTHINYIDCYRLYVLNNCNIISDDEKIKLNEKLTERIKKYVDLLDSDKVLKGANTTIDFVEHYKNQIEVLSKDWENFTIAISKNI